MKDESQSKREQDAETGARGSEKGASAGSSAPARPAARFWEITLTPATDAALHVTEI